MNPSRIFFTIMLVFFTTGLAQAANYAGFHKDLMVPYGAYKKSLALTSKVKNKDKAIQAVTTFINSWASLAQRHNTAPDEIKSSETFSKIMQRPQEVGQAALTLLQAGQVKKAHHVLEEVRYLLWHMRVEAGIISLNDKVNDFHEAMEVILAAVTASETAEPLQHAGTRYGAWLTIKWQDIAQSPFPGQNDTTFRSAVDDGSRAIKKLIKACREGDLKAAKKYSGAVKKAYKAIFFLPEVC